MIHDSFLKEFRETKSPFITNPYRFSAGFDLTGCKAYYKFEQTSGNLINQATSGNGFTDGLGSSADGTNNGATQNATGKIDNAWDFDGTNDYVQTSVKFNYLHDGTGGSISFWMKPSNMNSIHTNGDYIFDSMATSSANGTGISIRFNSNKTLRINYTTSSNAWFTNVNSTSTFSNNTWYHISVTFGSNTVKLYIDGSVDDTETYSNPNTNASGSNFSIGRHGSDPATYGYYDGILDEVSIWDRVLTNSEVTDLYNSGNGLEL